MKNKNIYDKTGTRQMRKTTRLRGQILPLVALTVLVLSMFSFLVWNIGIIEFNRQKVQTAADAAALSGARCRASFWNKMTKANIGCHAIVMAGPFGGWMLHNSKLGYMWKKSVNYYKNFIDGVKRINQGGGGMVAATAIRAAQLNDTKAVLYGFVKGAGEGTGMQGRKMKFGLYIKVGKFPVPAGVKTFNPAYFCRRWETGRRRAQPDQEYAVTVEKPNQTFAASLIGLGSPGKARAVSQAKIWLNKRETTSTWLHNGGFPRDKSEGAQGLSIEPIGFIDTSPFEACLVPAIGMIAH